MPGTAAAPQRAGLIRARQDNVRRGSAVTRRHSSAGRLLDRADLGAGELGVDEELERVELLVLLHEAVQRGAAQPGQCDAGGVAQQARLDDLQGEGVIALADEGGGGGGELLFPASGQQVECGGVLGRGGWLESLPVWLPVAGVLVVEPLG